MLNASQVTNPSIDPPKKPMELKTFLGKAPDALELEINDDDVEITTELTPNVAIETPIVLGYVLRSYQLSGV